MMIASSKLYPYQGMNATRTLHPSARSPPLGGMTVGKDGARLDPVTRSNKRTLTDAGVLVRAFELGEIIHLFIIGCLEYSFQVWLRTHPS